jgi:hypothetical protein
MTVNPLILGIGLVLLAAGLVTVTRRGGSEQAIYARRIVGMMLTAGGLALTVNALALGHWS